MRLDPVICTKYLYIMATRRPRRGGGPVDASARIKSLTSARSVRSVSITEARQQLCPLLKEVDTLPGRKVGITVSGDVAAYLISAKKLDELEAKARPSTRSPRQSVRGTIEIVGDLEAASGKAAADLEQMALEGWRGDTE